jgi:hypothetical protein
LQGVWGGPWLGHDQQSGSTGLEVDVAEYNRFNPYDVQATYHEWNGSTQLWSSSSYSGRAPESSEDLGDELHWFEVIWDTGVFTWLLDGQVFAQFKSSQTPGGQTWAGDSAQLELICTNGIDTVGIFGEPVDAATIAALPVSLTLLAAEVWT